jgi:2-keto-4-pentenoate hydratase/2-oxohepta-3-ene-1,7-dioic acid hydratase in catechol pathway
MTLVPGDIVATGTPSGVGIGFDPPRYLKPGDLVRVSIDGIGTLENRVRDARGGCCRIGTR